MCFRITWVKAVTGCHFSISLAPSALTNVGRQFWACVSFASSSFIFLKAVLQNNNNNNKNLLLLVGLLLDLFPLLNSHSSPITPPHLFFLIMSNRNDLKSLHTKLKFLWLRKHYIEVSSNMPEFISHSVVSTIIGAYAKYREQFNVSVTGKYILKHNIWKEGGE